jgi:hypothetical protein
MPGLTSLEPRETDEFIPSWEKWFDEGDYEMMAAFYLDGVESAGELGYLRGTVVLSRPGVPEATIVRYVMKSMPTGAGLRPRLIGSSALPC